MRHKIKNPLRADMMSRFPKGSRVKASKSGIENTHLTPSHVGTVQGYGRYGITLRVVWDGGSKKTVESYHYEYLELAPQPAKACENCDGLGYVCSKCHQADSLCQCPYNGGKRPAVEVCPKCDTPPKAPA